MSEYIRPEYREPPSKKRQADSSGQRPAEEDAVARIHAWAAARRVRDEASAARSARTSASQVQWRLQSRVQPFAFDSRTTWWYNEFVRCVGSRTITSSLGSASAIGAHALTRAV